MTDHLETASDCRLLDYSDRSSSTCTPLSPPGTGVSDHTLINRNRWPALRTVSETCSDETENPFYDVSKDTKDVTAVSPGGRQNSAKRLMTRLFCCYSRSPPSIAPTGEPNPQKKIDRTRRSVDRPRNLRIREYRMRRRLPSIPAVEDHLYSQIVVTPGSATSVKTVTTDDGGYETVVIREGYREHPGQNQGTYECLHRNEDYNGTYNLLKRPKKLDISQDSSASYSTLDRTVHYETNNYDHLQHRGRTIESCSVSIQDGIPFDSTVLITICLFGEKGKETPV